MSIMPGEAQLVLMHGVGGHGHRGLLDWRYGQTTPGVRHGLKIPLRTVRG